MQAHGLGIVLSHDEENSPWVFVCQQLPGVSSFLGSAPGLSLPEVRASLQNALNHGQELASVDPPQWETLSKERFNSYNPQIVQGAVESTSRDKTKPPREGVLGLQASEARAPLGSSEQKGMEPTGQSPELRGRGGPEMAAPSLTFASQTSPRVFSRDKSLHGQRQAGLFCRRGGSQPKPRLTSSETKGHAAPA